MNMGYQQRFPGFKWHPEAGHRFLNERCRIFRRSKQRPCFYPFRSYLLRLHCILGKSRAGFLFIFRSVSPPRLHGLGAVIKAQIPTALPLLLVNVGLMYVLAFR